MPFGLTNVLATFQHLMNDVLWNMLDYYVVTDLDDILIYSEHQPMPEQHASNILGRLCQYRLYEKLEDCVFKQPTVESKGVHMDPWKVEVSRDWAMT